MSDPLELRNLLELLAIELERRGVSSAGARRFLAAEVVPTPADRAKLTEVVQQELTRGSGGEWRLPTLVPGSLLNPAVLSKAGVTAGGAQQFTTGQPVGEEKDREQLAALLAATLGTGVPGGSGLASEFLRRGRKCTYAAFGPVPIPDNNPAGAALSVNVLHDAALIRLSTTVRITHSYRGDLVVTLQRNGVVIKMLENNSGGSAHDILATYEILAAELGGKRSGGVWSLRSVDNAAGDTGRIDRFDLTLWTSWF